MAKTEVDGYKNRYLKNFNHLKDKLMLLFTDNPNSKKFKFYGVSKDAICGLLVSGTDKHGISDFNKFFSVGEIQFYYDELNKRLQRR